MRVRCAIVAARDGVGDCEAGAGGGTVPVLPTAQTIIHCGSTCFVHDGVSAFPFVKTRSAGVLWC